MLWTSLALAVAASLSASGASASAVPGFISGFNAISEREFLDHFRLAKRQDVRCGANFQNAVCPDNLCCSQFGYCGDADIFCTEIANCQPNFGRCGDAPPPPTSEPEPTTTASPTETTGPTEPTTSTEPQLPPGTELTVTTNGMCGNTTTCAGSTFGGCCSQFFWCGASEEYCGTGCQSLFGDCEGGETPPVESPSPSSPPEGTASAEPPSSAEPTAEPTPEPSAPVNPGLPVSSDGSCGGTLGVTCIGSAAGNCCSRWGFCGDADLNCLVTVGCQPEWGECREA
ncbi:uncharacterized protein DNG_07887 [Cephalotrichum gorgonifer]|uniref:Chitin-binding type-1 domain-containing protein n=1 Tax=Cephalotrichum gorgonifer TaxID=2041049 RepID=A0AAE8N2H2_9PEZI|nr:uncharacterized protein DNG_07887 [Cephalotrichum gorgonifer]